MTTARASIGPWESPAGDAVALPVGTLAIVRSANAGQTSNFLATGPGAGLRLQALVRQSVTAWATGPHRGGASRSARILARRGGAPGYAKGAAAFAAPGAPPAGSERQVVVLAVERLGEILQRLLL